MFALDLFNTQYERELREGAVDNLEARRIDDLNAKMQELLARARNASPKMKAGLKREFDKVKAERDNYFKIKDECMGYGSIVGEADAPVQRPSGSPWDHVQGGAPKAPAKGLLKGKDLISPQQRVAGATPPSNTAIGKAKSTFASFANWLAGKDDTGPTYESAITEEPSVSPVTAAKYAYEQMRKAFDDNVDIATIRWMNSPEPITLTRNQLYHTMTKLQGMSRQNRNQFALSTLANRNNFALWLGGQKKVKPRPQLKVQSDPFQPELPLGKPQAVQERAPKKNSKDAELTAASAGDTQVARELQKLRAKHPAARTDIEALAKDELDHQARSDQQLDAIKGANTEQDTLLRQLVALDQKQGREIDNLDSENDSLEAQLSRIQATNDRLQQTIKSMTGTKKSTRDVKSPKAEPEITMPEPEEQPVDTKVNTTVDPAIANKIKGLETQIDQLQKQKQTPSSTVNVNAINDQIAKLQTRINSLAPAIAQAQSPSSGAFKPAGISKSKKSPKLNTPLGDLDIEPKRKTKSPAKPKSRVKKPQDNIDLLGIEEPDFLEVDEGAMSELDIERQDLEHMTDQQFLKAYGISKEFWKYKNQAVLKKPQRRPMSAQLARSPVGKKMNAMYGSTCPGCGRSTNPDSCICESTQRLHQGDPITVTAPNEFEGATGEIYDFSPSGTFVIVDLYNHGKHSMHLSDVEYNQYADEEVDEGYATAIGLNPPAVDPVKHWKNQVRQLIADYIDNPQGLYTLAKQKGANSAEAMAYKFIMHPKGKIDLPPDAVTFEGYQDFNKVEPYAVCLAGKPVKKFDYYEEARRFHDNWKKKLYREGDKAKADKITLMPLNLDEAEITPDEIRNRVGKNIPRIMKNMIRDYSTMDDNSFLQAHGMTRQQFDQRLSPEARAYYMKEQEQKPAGWGEFPPKQEITIVPPKKLKSGQTYQDLNKYWQSQGQAPIYKTNEAGSPAQQAAIAINMKKHHQKPKNESDDYDDGEWDDMPDAHVKVKAQQPTRYPEAVLRAIERNPAMRADIIADYKRKQGVAETVLNPRDPQGDYAAKRKALQDLGMNKDIDQAAVLQRRLDLDREAKAKGVAEAQTDYQKRRQRERDVDAGKPVSRQPKNPQTDYARKRAKERRDLEQFGEGSDLINMSDLQFYKELLGVMVIPVAAFGAMAWHKAMNAIKLYRAEDVVTALQKKGVTVDRSTLEQIKPLLLKLEQAIDVDKDGDVAKELAKRIQQTVTWGKLKQVNPDTTVNRKSEVVEEQDTSGVESAILRRIMTAHTDLLMKFGPEKVMQAAEEVAYNVGNVDEIGTSDVSAYVNQVKQILGVPAELDEKWSQKYKSSINCANPKGFSQKAHCAGKKK